jgi:poly(3-hydroxybutyrate) depolymerase
MRMRRLFAAVLALLAAAARASDPLPALGADPGAVTVSGISSGGYMAVQFHVAHSSVVKGVGVLAGGPYYCAQGSVFTAYYNCMTPGRWTPLPEVEQLKVQTEVLARARAVDPTENLAGAHVWLFSGTNDRTVDPAVVDALRRFYGLFKLTPDRLVLVKDRPAGHAMVTESVGGACPVTAPPFLNDCDFDAAGALLGHLLGPLDLPAAKESGRIIRFDQKPFGGGDTYSIGMADSGYAYIPKSCEAARCRIHVAFHGCRQSVEAIGERFVREAGYNPWADSNRLIVLYPQTVARNGWGMAGLRPSFIFNPRGCWDWWGYTGSQYATQAGPQIAAVKAMVDRLASPPAR